MNKIEKLKDLISSRKSDWMLDAKWRLENREWLSYSFDLALRILEVLEVKKMTQKDLAEQLGVSPQYISKIVKGKENLSLETIANIEKALGIRLIEISSEPVKTLYVKHSKFRLEPESFCQEDYYLKKYA